MEEYNMERYADNSSTENVIDYKRKILEVAPYAAANIEGRDVIYVQKAPGYDALIYDSGTAAIREGLGNPRKPRRYGSIQSALKALKADGYRLVNIFQGGAYEQMELQSKLARESRTREQSYFKPYDKDDQKFGNGFENNTQIQDFSNYIPQQRTDRPMQRTNRIYEQSGLQFEDPVKQLDKMTFDIARQGQTANEFSKFAREGYSNLAAVETQLGIQNIGKGYAYAGRKSSNKGRRGRPPNAKR